MIYQLEQESMNNFRLLKNEKHTETRRALKSEPQTPPALGDGDRRQTHPATCYFERQCAAGSGRSDR